MDEQTLENVATEDLTAGAALSAFAEKAAQQTSLPSTETEETIMMEGDSLNLENNGRRKGGTEMNVNQSTPNFEGKIEVENNPPKKMTKKRGRSTKPPSSLIISEENEQLEALEIDGSDEGKKEENTEGETVIKKKRGRPSQQSPLMMADDGEERDESYELSQLDDSTEEVGGKKKGVRSKIVRWTPKEDELLLKIVPSTVISEENPFFWRSIAKQIPGKTINQCFQHWNRVLNPKIRKGPWGPDEEAELVSYAEKLRGDVRHLWSRVAAMTQGRIDTQCRYQMRIIEKSGSVRWEKTEDAFLINTAQSEDRDQTSPKDWIKIAHKFNNKMARASSRKTPIRCALHVKIRYEYLNGIATDIGVSNESAGTSILPAVDSVLSVTTPAPDQKITPNTLPNPTPTYRGPVPSKIAHGSYPYSISGGNTSSGQVGRHMNKSVLGQNVVQVAADAIGLRDTNYSQYGDNPTQAYGEPNSTFLSQTSPRYNSDYSQHEYEQQIPQKQEEVTTSQPIHQYTSEQPEDYNNQDYDTNNGTSQEDSQRQIFNTDFNEEYPPNNL
eukprot:TRINITY_DN3376_c0_g1_i4.p1 TRINITY_DN3376_c0_g1~~TRINITY_DN3376_c0_g1_i4.p1  ORF type:complete len:555 (+),score=90.56 TRINITY_DN3376_c0_g1_i4:195-1859(+)